MGSDNIKLGPLRLYIQAQWKSISKYRAKKTKATIASGSLQWVLERPHLTFFGGKCHKLARCLDSLSVRGLGSRDDSVMCQEGPCAACMELGGRNQVSYTSYYRAIHQEGR